MTTRSNRRSAAACGLLLLLAACGASLAQVAAYVSSGAAVVCPDLSPIPGGSLICSAVSAAVTGFLDLWAATHPTMRLARAAAYDRPDALRLLRLPPAVAAELSKPDAAAALDAYGQPRRSPRRTAGSEGILPCTPATLSSSAGGSSRGRRARTSASRATSTRPRFPSHRRRSTTPRRRSPRSRRCTATTSSATAFPPPATTRRAWPPGTRRGSRSSPRSRRSSGTTPPSAATCRGTPRPTRAATR